MTGTTIDAAIVAQPIPVRRIATMDDASANVA